MSNRTWGIVTFIGLAALTAPPARAMTEADLRARIASEYPAYATAETDWQRVQLLREFSYRHTDWAPSRDSPLWWDPNQSMPAWERFTAFETDRKGVFCGNTARTLMHLYEMYGFNAYYVEVRAGPKFTHAQTLVRIRDGNGYILTLHDPSENFSYARPDGSPISWYEMLAALASGHDEEIATVGDHTVRADMLFAPSDYQGRSPELVALSSWTIEPNDYALDVIEGNIWKFRSPRTPRRAEQVMGSLYLPWLTSQGRPAKTIYINLNPIRVAGNSFGESADKVLHKALVVLAGGPLPPSDTKPASRPAPEPPADGHRSRRAPLVVGLAAAGVLAVTLLVLLARRKRK